MNRTRTTTFLALGLTGLLLGCGGGRFSAPTPAPSPSASPRPTPTPLPTPTPTPSPSPSPTPGPIPGPVVRLGRGLKVGLRLAMPAEPGYQDYLTPEMRQEMAKQGIVLEPTRIVSATTPAIGYYLEVAGKRYGSGPDGEFYLPDGVVAPNEAPLYKQLTDSAPIGKIVLAANLRPVSQPLPTVVLELQGRKLGSAQEMDGLPVSRAANKSCSSRAKNDGCNRVDYPDLTSNVPGESACYDYEIPKGRIQNEASGELPGDCAKKRVAEFFDTPCWQWTFGTRGKTRACINERAVLQVTGPGCWANHKYRFCQNLNAAEFELSRTGVVTLGAGESVQFKVRNNTTSNETQVLTLGNQGTLEGEALEGTVLKHYSDSEYAHYRERSLTYQAPATLPDGKREVFQTFNFVAGGMTRVLTFRIVVDCRDSRGRVVPCG